MKMNSCKKGFTLVEMLVVIGIISILSGALLVGYGRVTKSAQRARAQETVSNVATALGLLLNRNSSWPSAILPFQGKDGEGMGCVETVAKIFAKYDLLGVNYSGNKTNPTLKGTDRCGIVDPWAVSVLKRKSSNMADATVPTGGTVRDHRIYFAVDNDYDGITEAIVCGENVRVRASAIAWCAGADGKLGEGYKKKSKENSDNVYSWRRTQEVK